jgi:PTS system nitrogen regulatory IIA component
MLSRGREKLMRILDYLLESSVLFLDNNNKNEVLASMVAQAAASGLIPEENTFKEAIFERESIMSTGIGLQVAIPHAKLPNIEEFFVIPAILSQDSNWDAIDKKPVRLVFLIGGPTDRQTDYLMILSKITLVIKNPARRKALMAAKDAKAVLAAFAEL